MNRWKSVAVLGAGNIGTSIAAGLARSGTFTPGQITLTRRRTELLDSWKSEGFRITSQNDEAAANSDILILAVEPHQLDSLIDEVREEIDPKRHLIISIITGAACGSILEKIGTDLPVVRAMPNTAIAIRESMTCIASNSPDAEALKKAEEIFSTVGQTMVIREDQMAAATALCSSGIAFFLRAIRAASQAGVEIGFHAGEAGLMAAQTAKGAASLLLEGGDHPEAEVDRVTTPGGCTITGLNELERQGFSSALIQSIVAATKKAQGL